MFSAGNNLLPLNVLGRVTHHPLYKSGCVAPGFQMVKIFLIRTGILPPPGTYRTVPHLVNRFRELYNWANHEDTPWADIKDNPKRAALLKGA